MVSELVSGERPAGALGPLLDGRAQVGEMDVERARALRDALTAALALVEASDTTP